MAMVIIMLRIIVGAMLMEMMEMLSERSVLQSNLTIDVEKQNMSCFISWIVAFILSIDFLFNMLGNNCMA